MSYPEKMFHTYDLPVQTIPGSFSKTIDSAPQLYIVRE